MNEARYLELLNSLNEADFKKLGEFLRSPYFNKTQALITLYNYLKKIFPHFEKIDILYLSQTIYGSIEEQSKVKTLISEFCKMIEKFYTQITMEKNDLNMNNTLLKYYSDNNLVKNFEAVQKKIEKIIPKDFDRDENFSRLVYSSKI